MITRKRGLNPDHKSPLYANDADSLFHAETRDSYEDLEKALDKLNKPDGNLQRIIDTIPALVWCGLPDGSKEFLNKRWRDYTGLSSEESYGWGWQVAVHPEDLPLVDEKWRELAASGEPGEVENVSVSGRRAPLTAPSHRAPDNFLGCVRKIGGRINEGR